MSKSLWEFDTEQTTVQLDGLMSSSEVVAIRLSQVDRPDIYRERKQISGNEHAVVFPLRFTEEGKTHELGELTIIPDQTIQKERAIWQALVLSGSILLLVMLLAIIVNGIYQYLVISRLRGLALEFKQITPNDLREFTEQRTSSSASDDEFDELTYGVQSLKLTGQRALRDSDNKRTELETINKAYQALSAVNQLVVEADSEQELLDGACQIVRDNCGYMLVWIGLAQHDSSKSVLPIAEAGFEEGYLSTVNITWGDSERGCGPTGTAIRECRPVIASDIANNPIFAPWREQALKYGYASSAAFPLQDDKSMYGALMLYSGTIDPFAANEMALLQRLTSNMALGITKLRTAALRLAAKQSLLKSEQRFKDFSTASSDWFWETDEELRFTYFSEKSNIAIGVDPKTLLGRRSEEIFCIDDMAQQDKWAAHMQVLAKHFPFRGLELQMCTDLGRQWFSISGVPIFDGDGKFRGYRGTGANISVRKQYEIDLIEARQAAESANETKSRFLATMSHEIRTPMNGILGMAQLLLPDDVTVATRQDYVRTILNSGRTLLTLLNDILDLSKIEAGRLTLEHERFQPAQLLNEIQALFHESASQKQLHLFFFWAEDSKAHYLGDSHRLRQMISNLVSNALKFTAQGQIEVRGAEVERSGSSAILEFSVTDTGLGIPKDRQGLLFQPFSQVDSSITRQFGGTGLGLSIVRSLVETMGGTIGVDSESGKGSRFWFRIVVEAVSAGEDARGASSLQGEEKTSASHKIPAMLRGRILVVEDDPTDRKVVQALLNTLGVTVLLAEDGKRGVEIIQNYSGIDLVLMDIQMPVMDGLMAAREVRAWEIKLGKAHLPIIALTANAFEDDRRRAAEAGMDDFLVKPIALNALQLALERWLPSLAAEVTPAIKAEQSLDIARIQAILARLTPLLAENRFNAMAELKDLQAAVAGTRLEEKIANACKPLEQLKFSMALMHLHKIMQDENWEFPS